VSAAPDTLPEDAAALKALLIAERAELLAAKASAQTAQAEMTSARATIDRLRLIIKALQRHQFGRRSERLDPDQLQLGLEELEQTVASAEASAAAAKVAPRPRAPRSRERNLGALPAHLPRVEQVIEIEAKTCPCCSGALHVIGEDVAERLDVVPAQFRVLVTRRPKYACRACEGAVVQAPAPGRIVEAGLPTEALLAQVIVSKYADHLPLYRQAQIYARQGVALDRSTLADWVGRTAWWLKPLHERLLALLKTSTKLFADETRAPVLDPGRGRTKTGQLWAYARDDRPWGGGDPPAVAYVYAPDRKAERPVSHLAGFAGILQVDGYSGYRRLAAGGKVELAFCWSHVRRNFHEISTDRRQPSRAPIANEALRRIQELYAVEAEIRGRCAEQRRHARQERSKPILDALKTWLEARLAEVSQKATIAEAIRYMLGRWPGLVRFLDDGRVEIDSNTVERSIRPLALTRKNALFAGSDGGAEHWACLASLIETCKLNAIDPLAYLTATLTRLAGGHSINRIGELLPWAYAAQQARTSVA